MAPSFFSKLVKSPTVGSTRERSDRSIDSPRVSTSFPRSRATSSASSRGRITPEPVPPLPQSFSSFKPAAPNVSATNTSAADTDSVASSIRPNVTVVPPSPLIAVPNGLPSGSDVVQEQLVDGMPDDDNQTPTIQREFNRTALPSSSEYTAASEPQQMPTKSRTSSRPSTPASSVQKTTNFEATGANENAIHHSPSNRSLRSNNLAPLTTNHARAATTPELRSVPDDVGVGGSGNDPVYATMSPINESPTGIRPPEFPDLGSVAQVANGLISPPRDNSDTTSVISAAPSTNGARAPSKKPTARPWKRTGTKPTGLAGAIAASGLAMANPALSAPHQIQLPSVTTSPTSMVSASSGRKSSISSPPQGPSDLSLPSKRGKRTKGRKGSVSVHSDANSEYYPDDTQSTMNVDYYSGLEDDSSDDDDESADGDDLMDLDFGDDDIPVTGFAVASSRRNNEFHELFPQVPAGDYLIEDYGCALQREILIQGRLYISENHVCFHANIFGWQTDLVVPVTEILVLEKKMTAFVIPNAIQITTRHMKYSFASFLSRDTTFDVIHNIWRLVKPGDTGSVYSSTRGSLDKSMDQIVEGTIIGADGQNVVVTGRASSVPVTKVTQCTCGKKGEHYPEVAMDTIFPGTPDRIHNLIFASGFIKDFLINDQKLLDMQISDWTPVEPGSRLLARNMSYIKPLNGSIGPKQTKCELRDETVYCDFEDYVSTITTTRTPDVPSGGVFSVKTRTCITWASSITTRVLVTTQVEWTGRSFIKGIINSSCIDGQKTYHADLEKAMRAYIQAHQTEFLPEGVDPAVLSTPVAEAVAVNIVAAADAITPEEASRKREHERNQRGLQWAYDTFDGARQVGFNSAKGAIELIIDSWNQSSSTTILWFVITILVFSNLYTLTFIGAKETTVKMKENRKMEDREKWISGVVSAVWDEMATAHPTVSASSPTSEATPNSLIEFNPEKWHGEVDYLTDSLNEMESRLKVLRDGLVSLTIERAHAIDVPKGSDEL